MINHDTNLLLLLYTWQIYYLPKMDVFCNAVLNQTFLFFFKSDEAVADHSGANQNTFIHPTHTYPAGSQILIRLEVINAFQIVDLTRIKT